MRLATPNDADRIAELDMLLFDNCFNERTIGIELGLGPCWVEGTPVVAYVITRWDTNITDITRVAVHPNFQSMGLGKRLVEVALTTPGPHMLTVRKDNTRALRLYQKMDFEIISHLIHIPAWIMKREITLPSK